MRSSVPFQSIVPWVVLCATVLGCGGGGPDGTLPVATPTEAEPSESDPLPAAPEREQAPASPADPDVDVERVGALVLEGTPEIPEALSARLSQYLETRSAYLSDVAGDGSAILVGTRFGDTTQVHRVDRPGGARTQLTFAAEPIRGARFVPGDRGAIVYTADEGGDEQHQIFRLDLGTGRAVRLTDGKSRNGSYLWSHDGSALAYSSNTRNGKSFDVWVSDGADPSSAKLVAEASGWWYPLDFSRDGAHLLVGEYISVAEQRVYVVDLKSKETTRLTPEDAPAAYSEARFGRDADTVYVTSDRDGEFVELFETDREGKTWRSLTSGIDWDVSSFAVSHDRRTIAFTVNEGGWGTLHTLDTRTRKHRPVKRIPKGIVTGVTFARKAPVLGFTLLGPTMPGDAYTYHLRRRKLERWTESEVGGLDPATFVTPELIEYESFDGAKIPAFYYRPKGDGPHPVVVNIHGGPEGQSRPYFSSLGQYLLAEAGIAVVYPNVRGSTGYGKTYTSLDNAAKREDSVKDIGALLDWIAERPELDAERIGVLGGSYGGYMVLASLVHFGERIRAGVDVVGISSFVTFLENTADYRRDLRRVEYGDERDPEMRAHLEKISPLNRVDEIRSALFVAQGANDPRVPASEAAQIVAAVRASGQDVWYMLAENEGHGFSKKENRDVFLALTALFLERHLGGD